MQLLRTRYLLGNTSIHVSELLEEEEEYIRRRLCIEAQRSLLKRENAGGEMQYVWSFLVK
jgi:hypothetical protein